MEAQNFTVAEAADYLNVGETTLRDLMKGGLIPTFNIGTKTLISKMALDDLNDFWYREGGFGVCDD